MELPLPEKATFPEGIKTEELIVERLVEQDPPDEKSQTRRNPPGVPERTGPTAVDVPGTKRKFTRAKLEGEEDKVLLLNAK